MDDSTPGRAARLRGSARLLLPVLTAVFMATPMGPAAYAATPVTTTGSAGTTAPTPGVSAEATIVDGGFVDVFATSASPALQVEGQDGRFPTTPMSHDEGSTRFYARVPVSGSEPVASLTVRTLDEPPSTAVVDVRAIVVTRATYDGTTLTVAASAGATARYPLTVEAGGTVGTLPSAAPVAFPMSAPPRTITVSSGPLRTTAPVVVGDTAAGSAAPAAAMPSARAVTRTLAAPRGLATVIDGSASTDAAAFSTVIRSGPQGSTLVDADTATPAIVLPTWAAPTDVLPRVAPSTAPTVVTFTATRDGASSSVDVTVTPVGDDVVVTTARSAAGSDLQVAGTSTLPGTGPAVTPPTQVVVYARTTPLPDPTGTEQGWVKVGSSAVDDAGTFSVRSGQAQGATYVQYLIQTSRGTQVSGALAH